MDANRLMVEGKAVKAVTGERFTFTNIPDGMYFVTAFVGPDSEFAGSPPVAVQMRGGVFSPGDISIILSIPQITGIVKSSLGAGLTKPVSLRVIASDNSGIFQFGTTPDGAFKIGGLPIKSTTTYSIQAMPPPDASGTDGGSSPVSVTVGTSGALNLTIQLSSPSITGKVVLPDGSGVRFARVSVLAETDGKYSEVFTREDGRFSFGGLAAQSYKLRVEPPFGTSGVNGSVPQVVTVVAGSAADVGTITLPSATKYLKVSVLLDGRQVTDARIMAAARDGSGFVESSTTTDGLYAARLGPGTWSIMVMGPPPPTGNWIYGKEPKTVEFKNDTTTEVKEVSFVVQSASATVSGKIMKADGTAFGENQVFVRVANTTGFGNGGRVNAQGEFVIPVAPGTYRLFAESADAGWLPPRSIAETQIVVGTDSVSVGTITFVHTNSGITGRVVDGSGNTMSAMPVDAWRKDSPDRVRSITDANGVYTLAVVPGKWMIQPVPAPDASVGFAGMPLFAEAVDGKTVSAADLVLSVADSTIEGKILDAAGAPLTTLRGDVGAMGTGDTKTSGRGQITDGRFTIKVTRGKYVVSAFFPPGSGYAVVSSVTADTTAGGSTTVVLRVTATNATITGQFLLDGQPFTTSPTTVFADAGPGRFEVARADSTGTFTMNVVAGNWFVRGVVDGEGNGYFVKHDPTTSKVVVTEAGTTTYNFTVVSAGATVSGKVIDDAGVALAGVRVFVSDKAEAGKTGQGQLANTNTDNNGAYTLRVPAGTYRIFAAGARDRNIVPPPPSEIIVVSGKTTEANMQFRALRASITGFVTRDGVAQGGSFVHAHPAAGGPGISKTADATGVYTLPVGGGSTWIIQAGTEVASATSVTAYKSAPVRVTTPATGSVVQNLTLVTALEVPAAKSFAFDVSQQQTFTLSDGTTIVVPAGAAGTSGNATLRVTPKTQVEGTADEKPLGIAYDLTMVDESGTTISTFTSPVQIIFTYDPEKLPAGLTVMNLVPSYWDTVSNSWKAAENIVVNSANFTITISVTHFTDYGILADGSTQGQPRLYLPLVFNGFGYQ